MQGYSFIHRLDTITIALLLFAGMILMIFLGRLTAKNWEQEDPESKAGMNSLRNAILGLFTFILAFSFGMSSSRYDTVRIIFLDEANDISTAVLRADLYSDSIRKELRADFNAYVEARIALYSNLQDTAVFHGSQRRAAEARSRLWKRVTDQSKMPNMLIPSNNMLPALNNMFDIADKREALLKTLIPDMVIYMLLVLALASSFISGVTSGKLTHKDWIVIFFFTIFTSIVIFITLELGRPLRGYIKAKASIEAITDLRKLFTPEQ